jgi:hypothetical protein
MGNRRLFTELVTRNILNWTCLYVYAAAVRQQFPAVTEESINIKMSSCLAQSSDREALRADEKNAPSKVALLLLLVHLLVMSGDDVDGDPLLPVALNN